MINMPNKVWAGILAVFFIAFGHNPGFSQDKILAIVNKDVITQREFEDFSGFMKMQLSMQFKGAQLEEKYQDALPDLLPKLIEEKLILGQAKKNKIYVDENKIKARVDEVRSQYRTDREFQDVLAQQGLAQSDVEEKVREQLLMYAVIENEIRSRIVINPGEVTGYYHNNPDMFIIKEQRQVSSLIVKDNTLVSAITEELAINPDFSAIAHKYNLVNDEITVSGDGTLRKDVEDVVFSLKDGEVSSAQVINDITYFFRFDSSVPSRKETLAEVQDSIRTLLYNQKMQEALKKWLIKIKSESYIKIIQG